MAPSNHQRGHTSGQYSLVNEFRQSLENHIDTSYDMSFTFDAEPSSLPVRQPSNENVANNTNASPAKNDIKVVRSREGQNISLMTNGRQPDESSKHYKPKTTTILEMSSPPSSATSTTHSSGSTKKGGFFGMFNKNKAPQKAPITTTANSSDITAIRYDAMEQKDAPVEVMFLPARNGKSDNSNVYPSTGTPISKKDSRNQRVVVHKQSVASSLAKSSTNPKSGSTVHSSPFNVIYGDDHIEQSSSNNVNIYRTDTKSSFTSNRSQPYNQSTPRNTTYDVDPIQQPSFNIYSSNFTGSVLSLGIALPNSDNSNQQLLDANGLDSLKEELVSPTELQRQNMQSLGKKSSIESLKDAIKTEGKKLKNRMSMTPTDMNPAKFMRSPRFADTAEFSNSSPEFDHYITGGNTIGQEIQINKRSATANGSSSFANNNSASKLQTKKSFLRKFSGGNTKKSSNRNISDPESTSSSSIRRQVNESFQNELKTVPSITSSTESRKNKKYGALEIYSADSFSSPTLVSTTSNGPIKLLSKHNNQIKEGDPEWYVKVIMDKNLSNKKIHYLHKKLKKENPDFLQRFLKAQGHVALCVVLLKIAQRSIKTNEQLDREYLILKCLKIIFHDRPGADLAIETPQCILASTSSLTSPRLSTRKLVTEILALLSYSKQPEGRDTILRQIKKAYKNSAENEELIFLPWLSVVEKSLDTRDIIGPLISNPEEFKSTTSLQDYCLTTLFLITSLVEGADQLNERIRIRNLFKNCSLSRIFVKMRALRYNLIDEQIDRYEEYATFDYEELVNISHENHAPVEIEEIAEDLIKTNKGTERENYLSSIVQNLLLVNSRKTQNGSRPRNDVGQPELDVTQNEDVTKMYQLIDSVVYHIVLESSMPGLDPENVLNGAIHRIMDRMQTDDIARRAVLESKELSTQLRDVKKERDSLREQLNLGPSGRLTQLAEIINHNEADLKEKESKVLELTQTVKELEKKMKIEQDKHEKQVQKLINAAHNKSNSGSPSKNVAIPYSETKKEHGHNLVNVDLTESSAFNGANVIKDSTNSNITAINQNLQAIKRMSLLGSPSAGLLADVLNLSNQNSPNIPSPSREPQGVAIMKEPHVAPEHSNNQNFEQQASHFDEVESTTSSKEPEPELVKQASAPPSPPPLPPAFTNQNNLPGSGSEPPPPPPPPPGMPGFLSPLSPPPPPPVPTFLLNSEERGSQPPPPPLPRFLSGSKEPVSSEKAATHITKSMADNDSDAPKPKKKLKQIHWDKVDDVKPTFWADKAKVNMIDELWKLGVLEEVETYFPAKESKIKVKTKSLNLDGEKVSFLSRDLAQQFGINLHMFASVSEKQFVTMVLRCDNVILENLNVLEFFNKEELTDITDTLVRNLKPYSTNYTTCPPSPPERDPEELDRADRIYLELCFNLKHYWKSRSRALLVRHTYSKDYIDLEKKLQKLDTAIDAVKESSHLKDLLDIIRSVGNFMNDISKQAKGFKIGTLQRLKFMKDDKNTMTFLHYIEKIVRTYFPNISEFVDDLEDAVAIANLSIEQLENDCRFYDRQIKNIDASLNKGNLSDPSKLHPDDKVLSVISKDLARAHTKSRLLISHLKDSLENYSDLMVYFGENVQDVTARNTFFQKFSNFIQEYKKAHIENIQREEEQRAYEVRKRLIESRSNKHKNIGSSDNDGNKPGHGQNKSSKASAKALKSTTDSNSGSTRDGSATGEGAGTNEKNEIPELVDDEDDDDDDDDDDETNVTEDERASTAVIDTLLQKLRASAPDATGNSTSRRRLERKQRLSSLGLGGSSNASQISGSPVVKDNDGNSRGSSSSKSSPDMQGDVTTRAQNMLQQLRINDDPNGSDESQLVRQQSQSVRAKDKLRELRSRERTASNS